jgi:hypothetical protein
VEEDPIVPRCASTIARAMLSPRPTPPLAGVDDESSCVNGRACTA